MCFFIHPDYPIALIAEKDIICYKRMWRHKGIYLSYFQDDKYKFTRNWLQKFQNKPKKCVKTIKNFGIMLGEIHQGLHSYSLPIKNKSSLDIMLNAIIPKGTLYYYNPFYNEYVSLALTVYDVPA